MLVKRERVRDPWVRGFDVLACNTHGRKGLAAKARKELRVLDLGNSSAVCDYLTAIRKVSWKDRPWGSAEMGPSVMPFLELK